MPPRPPGRGGTAGRVREWSPGVPEASGQWIADDHDQHDRHGGERQQSSAGGAGDVEDPPAVRREPDDASHRPGRWRSCRSAMLVSDAGSVTVARQLPLASGKRRRHRERPAHALAPVRAADLHGEVRVPGPDDGDLHGTRPGEPVLVRRLGRGVEIALRLCAVGRHRAIGARRRRRGGGTRVVVVGDAVAGGSGDRRAVSPTRGPRVVATRPSRRRAPARRGVVGWSWSWRVVVVDAFGASGAPGRARPGSEMGGRLAPDPPLRRVAGGGAARPSPRAAPSDRVRPRG